MPEPAEPGVRELRAPVWTEPLTAEEWVARDPELEPDCGYRYRFEPHELEAIKRCHDNHGFVSRPPFPSLTLSIAHQAERRPIII